MKRVLITSPPVTGGEMVAVLGSGVAFYSPQAYTTNFILFGITEALVRRCGQSKWLTSMVSDCAENNDVDAYLASGVQQALRLAHAYANDHIIHVQLGSIPYGTIIGHTLRIQCASVSVYNEEHLLGTRFDSIYEPPPGCDVLILYTSLATLKHQPGIVASHAEVSAAKALIDATFEGIREGLDMLGGAPVYETAH